MMPILCALVIISSGVMLFNRLHVRKQEKGEGVGEVKQKHTYTCIEVDSLQLESTGTDLVVVTAN